MAHKRLVLCGAVIAVLCSLSAAGPIGSSHQHRSSHHRHRSGDDEFSTSSSFESASCSPQDSVFRPGQTYLFKYTATIETTLGDRAPNVFGTSTSSRGLPWESQSDIADHEEYDPTSPISHDGAKKLPKVASLLTCQVELSMTDACKAELYVPQCKVYETSPANEHQHDPNQPIAAVLVAEQKPTPEQHEQLVRQAFAQHASEDGSSQQLSALVSRYPVKALFKNGQVVALKAHKREATPILNIKRAILDTLQFNQQRAQQGSAAQFEGPSSSKKEKSVFGDCPTKYSPSRDGGIKIEKNLSRCTKLHMAVSGNSKCFVETERQNAATPFSVVCIEKQVLVGAYNNTKMTPVQPVILTTRSIKPTDSPASSSGSSSGRYAPEDSSSTGASLFTTTLAFEPVDELTAAEQLASVLDNESNQRILARIDQVLEKLVQVTLTKEAVTPKSVELFQVLLVKIKTVKNIEPLVTELFNRCPAKMSSQRGQSDECPLELKIKRDYLLQALIQTPTKAAMQAVMTLINNDLIEQAIYEPLLHAAAFTKFAKQTTMAAMLGAAPRISPASYDYLTRMVELCEQKPTRYCVLSLSTIAHEVYEMVVVNGGEQHIPEPVERAVQFLVRLIEPGQCRPSEVLHRSQELTETDAVLLALKAWGNAGDVIEAIVPEFAEQYVVPCIQKFTTGHEGSSRGSASFTARRPQQESDSLNRKQRRFNNNEEQNEEEDYSTPSSPHSGHYPLNVTWSAVFALRRTTPAESVKRVLFDLILSERVPVEPRIAAVIQLTRFLTPQDQEIISHILQTVRSEQSSGSSTTHVWSFIVSHWKNLLRSSDPYYVPIADVFTKIEPNAYEILRQVERKIVEKRRGTFSRAYEISMVYELPFPVPGYSQPTTPYGESTTHNDAPHATVGFQYEQTWIFTPHSYLPTFVLTNFSLGTFSKYTNAIEVGVDLSEVEQQLERTFGRQSAALVPLKQLFGLAYNMFNRVVSQFEDAWYTLAVNPSHLLQTIMQAWGEYKQTGNLYGRKVSVAQIQAILSNVAHTVQTGDSEPLVQAIEQLMPARSQFNVRNAVHKIELAAKRLMSVTNRPLNTDDLIEIFAAIGVPQQITQQLVMRVEQMTGAQPIDSILRAIQSFDVERLVVFANKMFDATVMKRIEQFASQLLDTSSGSYFNNMAGDEDNTDFPSSTNTDGFRKLLRTLNKMISRINIGVYVKVAGNELAYFNVREVTHALFERFPKFIAQRQQQMARQMQGGNSGSFLSEMLPMMNIKLFDFDMPIPTASGLQLTTGVRTILATAVKTSFVAKNGESGGSAKEFVIKTKPSFVLLNEVVLLQVGLPGIFGAKLSSKMSWSHKSDFGFYGKKPTGSGSAKKSIAFGFVVPEEPVTLLQLEQKLVHKVGMTRQSEHEVASTSSSPQIKRMCTPQAFERVTKSRVCAELSSPSQVLFNALSSFRNMYGASSEESTFENDEDEQEPSPTGRRASKYDKSAYNTQEEDEIETTDENEPWTTSPPANIASMPMKYWKKYMKFYKAIMVGPTKLRLVFTPKQDIRSKALVFVAKMDKSAQFGGQDEQQNEEQYPPRHRRNNVPEQYDEQESYGTDETKIQPTDAFTVKLVLKDVAHLVEQISSRAPGSSSRYGPSSNADEEDNVHNFDETNEDEQYIAAGRPRRSLNKPTSEKEYEPSTSRRHHSNEDENDEEDDENVTPSGHRDGATEETTPEGKVLATGRVHINRYKKAVVVQFKVKNNEWTKNKKLVLFAKPQVEKVQGVAPGKGYKIAIQLVDASAQSETTGRHVPPCEIFAHFVVRKSGHGSSSANFEQDNVEEEQPFGRSARASYKSKSSKYDNNFQDTEEDNDEPDNSPTSGGSGNSIESIVKPEANITFTYGIRLPQKFVCVTKNSLLKKQQKIWVEHEMIYGVSPRFMPQSVKFFMARFEEVLVKFKEQLALRNGLIVDIPVPENTDNLSAAGLFGQKSHAEHQSPSSSSSFKPPLRIKWSYGVDAKRPSSFAAEQDQTDIPQHAEGKIMTLRLFTSLKTYGLKTDAPEPIFVLVQDIAVDVRHMKFAKLSSKAVWRSLMKPNTMSLAKVEWKWQNKTSHDESARSGKVEYYLTIENPLMVVDWIGAMKESHERDTCHTSNRVGIVFAPWFTNGASGSAEEEEQFDMNAPHRNRRAHSNTQYALEDEQEQTNEQDEIPSPSSSGRHLRKERVMLRKIIGDVDEELTKLRRQYFSSKKNTIIVEVFPRKLAAQQQLTKFNVSMVTITTSEDGPSSSNADSQQWFTSSPSRQAHHELNEQSPAAGLTRFNTEIIMSVKPPNTQDRLAQILHMTTNMEAKVLGKNIMKTFSTGSRHRRQHQHSEDETMMSSTNIPAELVKIAFDTVGTIVQKRIPDEELARQQEEQPFKFVVPHSERQSSGQGKEDIVMSGLFKIHTQKGLLTRLHVDTVLPKMNMAALSPSSRHHHSGEEEFDNAPAHGKKIRVSQFMEICPTRQKFIVSLNVTSPIVQLKSYGQLTRPLQVGSVMYWFSESTPREGLHNSQTAEIWSQLLTHRASVFGVMEQQGESQTTWDFEHAFLAAKSQMSARFVPAQQLFQQPFNQIETNPQMTFVQSSPILRMLTTKIPQWLEKSTYLRKLVLPTSINMDSQVLVKNSAQPEILMKMTTKKMHLKTEISLRAAQMPDQKFIIDFGKLPVSSQDKLVWIAKLKHIPSEKALAFKIGFGPRTAEAFEHSVEDSTEDDENDTPYEPRPHGGPRVRRQHFEQDETVDNKKVLFIELEQHNILPQQQGKSKLLKIELSLKKDHSAEQQHQDWQEDEDDQTEPSSVMSNTQMLGNQKLAIKVLVRPAPFIKTLIHVQKSALKTAIKLVDVVVPDDTIEDIAQKFDTVLKEPRNPFAKFTLNALKMVGIKSAVPSDATLEQVLTVALRQFQRTPIVQMAGYYLDVAPQQITPWNFAIHLANFLKSTPLTITLLNREAGEDLSSVPQPVQEIIKSLDVVMKFFGKMLDMTAGRYANRYIATFANHQEGRDIPTGRNAEMNMPTVQLAQMVRKMLKQSKKDFKTSLVNMMQMSEKPENLLLIPLAMPTCIAVKKANELEVSKVVKAFVKITFATLEQVKRDTLQMWKLVTVPQTSRNYGGDEEYTTGRSSFDFRIVGDQLIKFIPHKLPQCPSRFSKFNFGAPNTNEQSSFSDVDNEESSSTGALSTHDATEKVVQLIEMVARVLPVEDFEVQNVPEQEALKIKAQVPIAAKQIKKFTRTLEKILSRMDKKYTKFQSSSFWSSPAWGSNNTTEDDESYSTPSPSSGRRGHSDETTTYSPMMSEEEEPTRGAQRQLKRAIKY